jgi:hypothetical protein
MPLNAHHLDGENTPEYLLPQMGGTTVSEPVIYRSLFILDTLGESQSTTSELGAPIDPFDDAKLASAHPETLSFWNR